MAGWRFLFQSRLPPQISAAADRQLRSAAEHDDVIVVAVRLNLGDPLEVDEIGAVNADEPLGSEGLPDPSLGKSLLDQPNRLALAGHFPILSLACDSRR